MPRSLLCESLSDMKKRKRRNAMSIIKKSQFDSGIKNNDIAIALGVTAAQTSKLLRGDSEMQISQLSIIANVLKMSDDDIVRVIKAINVRGK